MKENQLKELKSKLDWLEKTPFYIGSDGAPSPVIFLFILFTGIILGIIIMLSYRKIRKYQLKKKITELQKNR